jgi:capsular polysaccharide transport system permease protein
MGAAAPGADQATAATAGMAAGAAYPAAAGGGVSSTGPTPGTTGTARTTGPAAANSPVGAGNDHPKRRAHVVLTGDQAVPPTEGAAQAPSAPDGQTPPKPGAAGEVTSAREATIDAQIDEIRREGLTGRQLRMARRLANKHKIPATSDFDAVRLLRERGIDPFQKSNMADLVVPKGAANAQPDGNAQVPAQRAGGPKKVQLPQTVPTQKQSLPSTDNISMVERREKEIREIQRDIVRRRRKKLLLLATRLSFFVLLPTLIVLYYLVNYATPMYSTKSEFLILQADGAMGGAGGGLGGLLSGTTFATTQDSIAVQSYLASKDAMLRLDAEHGFRAHFSADNVDEIQRLEPDATNEQAYKIYSKRVKIGYAPTEGVDRMEVTAADPDFATTISSQLISYAEERVNELSEQKRADQMSDAMQGFEQAQVERRKAQEDLVQLQLKGALLDPEGVITSLRTQISSFETQLQEKQLALAALLDNSRPNRAKVDGLRGDIGRLEDMLATLNQRMVDASKGENSLAELTVRIQMAQADLATRDLMLQSALQQLEATRMEANRQVRYLTTSVVPVPSEDPSYPRVFENTLLAFLVFAGIYLMLSLTASILREQVTT